MKKTIYCIVAVGALVCLSLLLPVNVISYEAKKDVTKEKDRLDIYLDSLATHECRDCPHGYRRLDSNKKYSYGCLQFQQATFDAMVSRYRLIPERSQDNTLDISRCEDQKRVARAMFLDDPRSASFHWYTSIYKRGLGLPEDAKEQK